MTRYVLTVKFFFTFQTVSRWLFPEAMVGRKAMGAILAAGCAAVFGLGCAAEPSPPPPVVESVETLRDTGLGRVIGFETESGAHAWRGLPFATPPVGESRWRAPRPPQAWAGTRESLEFASPCVQFAGLNAEFGDGDEGDVFGSEDCLYLNVFAPPFLPDEVPKADEALPVMVWIHGGGNTMGDAHLYDGSTLARGQNVIVVTIHYRMGAFGWFYHEALNGADSTLDDRSGNYGTLDTVAALVWVREHIASFGGDPNRVTVFGESAGGTDVFGLLATPRAAGLFHGAIVQSGSGHTNSIAQARNSTDASLPGHQNSSAELLYSLLVQDGTASDRDDAKAKVAQMSAGAIGKTLRGKTPEEILGAIKGKSLGGMYSWPSLVRDGVVLPEVDILEAFSEGRYNAVPTIFGTNRDENKLFMAFGSEYVTHLAQMPIWFNNARMYDLVAEYGTKGWKARGADEAAEAMSRSGRSRAFVYRFDWDEEGSVLWLDLSQLFGAAHALEVPFVFGNLDFGPATSYIVPEESRAEAEALSKTMMDYWGRFARTGEPGGEGADAPWPAWEVDAGRFILLDSQSGGGGALSTETVTGESVIKAVANDSRFRTAAERCEIYGQFVVFGGKMTEEEYLTVLDGSCADLPLPIRG